MMLIHSKRMSHAATLAIINQIFNWVKVSFIVGSKAAFFSATQCIAPLVGRYGGIQTSLTYCMIRTVFKIFMTWSFSFLLVSYHIPSFFQSLYFALIAPAAEKKVSFRVQIMVAALPLLCMLFFFLHPVGNKAFFYSFFWIFPAIMPFIKTKNLFLHSLAATFIAHAVGSIIWLSINPMTPHIWMSLIPIVCLERLFFAAGTVILSKLWDIARAWGAQRTYLLKARSIYTMNMNQ